MDCIGRDEGLQPGVRGGTGSTQSLRVGGPQQPAHLKFRLGIQSVAHCFNQLRTGSTFVVCARDPLLLARTSPSHPHHDIQATLQPHLGRLPLDDDEVIDQALMKAI